MTDVLRVPDRRPPERAHRRPAARGAAALILAVVAVIALAGLTGSGSSTVPLPLGAQAHLGTTHLTASGIDGVLAVSSRTAAAPGGQRTTPGALTTMVIGALLVALLLALPTGSQSPHRLARQRLPLRRAPPRDAFSR